MNENNTKRGRGWRTFLKKSFFMQLKGSDKTAESLSRRDVAEEDEGEQWHLQEVQHRVDRTRGIVAGDPRGIPQRFHQPLLQGKLLRFPNHFTR